MDNINSITKNNISSFNNTFFEETNSNIEEATTDSHPLDDMGMTRLLLALEQLFNRLNNQLLKKESLHIKQLISSINSKIDAAKQSQDNQATFFVFHGMTSLVSALLPLASNQNVKNALTQFSSTLSTALSSIANSQHSLQTINLISNTSKSWAESYFGAKSSKINQHMQLLLKTLDEEYGIQGRLSGQEQQNSNVFQRLREAYYRA